MTYVKWHPERQPGRRACEECRANPEKQVLPGHDQCLPHIGGMYTLDHVPVTVGLRVWDYDLRPGTVETLCYHYDGTPDGPLGVVAWHMIRCDNGGSAMQDGTRLWTVHPTTGHRPPYTEAELEQARTQALKEGDAHITVTSPEVSEIDPRVRDVFDELMHGDGGNPG